MTESGKRIAPFGLRLPPDLKERVSEAAAANKRSVNAEIVGALLEMYPEPSDFDLGEFITRWSKRLDAISDSAEIERLTAIANVELETANIKWRLEASPGKNGPIVRLVGHVDDWKRL